MKDRIFFILGLCLFICACRSDSPPKIEVCILDGVGGGDCVEADGLKRYRAPSEMKIYWATGELDMQNFTSWCYRVNSQVTQTQMDKIKMEVSRP